MEVAAVFELNIDLITGLMLGIEFPPPEEIDEDLTFCMAIDLFIVRLVLLKWKPED